MNVYAGTLVPSRGYASDMVDMKDESNLVVRNVASNLVVGSVASNLVVSHGSKGIEEVRTLRFYTQVTSKLSQPNVIKPKPNELLYMTGASPRKNEIIQTSTGSWPPPCAKQSYDSSFTIGSHLHENIRRTETQWIEELKNIIYPKMNPNRFRPS